MCGSKRSAYTQQEVALDIALRPGPEHLQESRLRQPFAGVCFPGGSVPKHDQLAGPRGSKLEEVVRLRHGTSVGARGSEHTYAEAVTIHSGHPFLQPESERDPVRRFRGRLGGAVSLWTTGAVDEPGTRAGLPVSSLLVAAGEPAHIVALLDPDSDLVERLEVSRVAVVQLLQWRHRQLADAFAGTAPAPGGAFRLGNWTESPWGPVVADVGTWVGVRLVPGQGAPVGWSVLIDTIVEHVEVGEESAPLVHRRGHYQRLDGDA